ncbi:tetratricopeptide repeat protein [Sorangium cellulosum]|uniref:tetratricopeptide repeat protein n=1 Tax=Sorangium cellulosum TaxID=56 RepID=UPI001331AB6E|nr:tetratricopeptide repeat protein [Sorangium cellulosum]
MEPGGFERILGSERGVAYGRFLEWSVGEGFVLAVVELRRPAQREALAKATSAAVAKLCTARLDSLGDRSLRALLEEACPSPEETSVLMLTHLEESQDAARICAELNVHRDELARRFALPWVLLVHPAAALALQRDAPDFCDFAGLWLPEEPGDGAEPLLEQAIRVLATSGVSPHHLSPDATPPTDLLSLAREAAALGHVDQAADLLAQYDMKHPGERAHDVRRVYMDGLLLRVRGRFAEAIARFDEALELCEMSGDPHMRGVLLDEIAQVYVLQGDLAAARHLERDALELFEQSGDRRRRAASLHQLSVIEGRLGHDVKARELEEKSLQLSEELGDQVGRTISLHHLAVIEGDHAKARELLHELLVNSDKLGDRNIRLASLRKLAALATNDGNYAEARELLRKSLELSEEMESAVYRSVVLRDLATVACLEGNYAEAMAASRESLKLSEEFGMKDDQAALLLMLGLLEADQGQIERSVALVREGVDILEELDAANLVEAKELLHRLESFSVADMPNGSQQRG